MLLHSVLFPVIRLRFVTFIKEKKSWRLSYRPIVWILIHLLRHVNILFDLKTKHQRLERLVRWKKFLERLWSLEDIIKTKALDGEFPIVKDGTTIARMKFHNAGLWAIKAFISKHAALCELSCCHFCLRHIFFFWVLPVPGQAVAALRAE